MSQLFVVLIVLLLLRFPFILIKILWRAIKPLLLIGIGFAIGVVTLAQVPSVDDGLPKRKLNYTAALSTAAEQFAKEASRWLADVDFNQWQSAMADRVEPYLRRLDKPHGRYY